MQGTPDSATLADKAGSESCFYGTTQREPTEPYRQQMKSTR
jgi:hypothetical protein